MRWALCSRAFLVGSLLRVSASWFLFFSFFFSPPFILLARLSSSHLLPLSSRSSRPSPLPSLLSPGVSPSSFTTVNVEYYRSYGFKSRVFFRAQRVKPGSDLAFEDNFAGSRELHGGEGWLGDLPAVGDILEARAAAGSAMGDAYGTCFALLPGEFVDHVRLPTLTDVAGDRGNDAKTLSIVEMCDKSTPVTVSDVVGTWSVAGDDGTVVDTGDGNWGVMERSVRYR